MKLYLKPSYHNDNSDYYFCMLESSDDATKQLRMKCFHKDNRIFIIGRLYTKQQIKRWIKNGSWIEIPYEEVALIL